MFEFLSIVGPEQAVSAANIAIRLLERRHDVLNDDIDELSYSEEWSSDEAQLAFRALTEIQNNEVIPLHDLSEEVSNKYILALAQVATDSTSETLSVSELKRGREILEAWKNENPANDSEALEEVAKPLDVLHKANRSLKIRPEVDRYRDMSDEELRNEAQRLRESLFRLNFKLALGEVDAMKRIRREKQSLRRLATIMKRRHPEQYSN